MKVWKYAVTGYLGGMIYVGLELLWRRWSHGSMFLVGGICFLLIGLIPRLLPNVPELMQAVLGACAVTATELISGLIINDALKLHVWDYSAMPYNFLGQVCMSYFFLCAGNCLETSRSRAGGCGRYMIEKRLDLRQVIGYDNL